MENKLRNLKEKMNETVLKDIVFDKKNENNVLKTIKKSQDINRSNYLKQKMNIILSVSVLFSLLLGIVGFVGKELGLYTSEENHKSMGSAKNKEALVSIQTKKMEIADPIKEYKVKSPKYNSLDTFVKDIGDKWFKVSYDPNGINSNEVEYQIASDVIRYINYFGDEIKDPSLKEKYGAWQKAAYDFVLCKCEDDETRNKFISYLLDFDPNDKHYAHEMFLETEVTKLDFSTDVHKYIEFENKNFQNVKVRDSHFDKVYFQYLETSGISNVLHIVDVKGTSLERDFNNLQKLASIIDKEQGKRSEDIDWSEYEENKRDFAKHWKAPSKRMLTAIEYTKQLLNDLDVALNYDGEGKTFGVSYQAGGNKVKEFEKFLYGVE